MGKFAAGLFGALFCFQQATVYLSFKERNCGFWWTLEVGFVFILSSLKSSAFFCITCNWRVEALAYQGYVTMWLRPQVYPKVNVATRNRCGYASYLGYQKGHWLTWNLLSLNPSFVGTCWDCMMTLSRARLSNKLSPTYHGYCSRWSKTYKCVSSQICLLVHTSPLSSSLHFIHAMCLAFWNADGHQFFCPGIGQRLSTSASLKPLAEE